MTPSNRQKLLADVNAFCEELRPIEELCYVERRFNDQLLPLAKKHNILGMPVPVVTFAYPKGRTGRISAFIVDTKTPGFQSEDLTAKLGMPTANTAMFEMTDCKVPVANMLGEEGDGFRIAMGTLVSGRISVASGCLGVIEDCLAEVLTYAKERKQHGKEIARHQLVQEHIAMIEQHRASAEAMVMRAAEAKDASHADPKNAELKTRADLYSSHSNLFAFGAASDPAHC